MSNLIHFPKKQYYFSSQGVPKTLRIYENIIWCVYSCKYIFQLAPMGHKKSKFINETQLFNV